MVVFEGARLVLPSLTAGLLLALAATRLMRGLLYGVSPTDGLTFVIVPLLLGTVAFAACYLPARRASRVSPLVILRGE
jgi:ABC-type lipoprotein release transport system permease subunit